MFLLLWEGRSLTYVARAGHAMIIENTGEVAATILAYLAEHRIHPGKC